MSKNINHIEPLTVEEVMESIRGFNREALIGVLGLAVEDDESLRASIRMAIRRGRQDEVRNSLLSFKPEKLEELKKILNEVVPDGARNFMGMVTRGKFRDRQEQYADYVNCLDEFIENLKFLKQNSPQLLDYCLQQTFLLNNEVALISEDHSVEERELLMLLISGVSINRIEQNGWLDRFRSVFPQCVRLRPPLSPLPSSHNRAKITDVRDISRLGTYYKMLISGGDSGLQAEEFLIPDESIFSGPL